MTNATRTKPPFAHLVDWYAALSLPMRAAVVAAILVAVAVAYCTSRPARTDWTHLSGGQEYTPAQLQSVCRALAAEGLHSFELDGTRIKVPREQAAPYAAAVSKHDALPAGFYDPMERAAQQSSFWSTRAQDDRRWELGKQKTLAHMIEQMPEVETASVLVDRAPPRGLRSDAEVRATITIKPRAGRELPAPRVRQIRDMVVHAVAELRAENVAVVDLHGRALAEPGTDDEAADDLLLRMKAFEEHYSWKIRNVLAFLPEVMVTVNVELDTTRQRRTEQVVLASNSEPALEPASTDPRPVVSANAAVDLEPVPDPTTEPVPTQQQTWEEHVPLAPKSLTIAVLVPQDLLESIPNGRGSESPATPWRALIQDRVSSAIPAGVATRITVESYPRIADRLARPAAPARWLETGWIPWAATAALAVMLSLSLTLGSVRRHRRRAHHETESDPGTPHPTLLAPDRSSDAAAIERRELVRVERIPAGRARGPHLKRDTITSFEDLRWLAPASLQAVLGAVDSRLWAPALRGASRELCERVLTHLPTRAATLLRDEIEYPGPVRLGDVEKAQQEILEVVRRLDHTGDLVLEDREEIRHD